MCMRVDDYFFSSFACFVFVGIIACFDFGHWINTLESRLYMHFTSRRLKHSNVTLLFFLFFHFRFTRFFPETNSVMCHRNIVFFSSFSSSLYTSFAYNTLYMCFCFILLLDGYSDIVSKSQRLYGIKNQFDDIQPYLAHLFPFDISSNKYGLKTIKYTFSTVMFLNAQHIELYTNIWLK